MSSRDDILSKLQAAQKPFPDQPTLTSRQHFTPLDNQPAALEAHFITQAEALGCHVHRLATANQAVETLLQLIAPDNRIQSWDPTHIPLPGLATILRDNRIAVAPGDTSVRTGLTGVDAALAGTGSLVLVSGAGKPRQPSLLPPVHIAVMTAAQIVPDLDTWMAAQRPDNFQALRAASNIVLVSGPSRTGDIANIPVMGVHGPETVHIIIY